MDEKGIDPHLQRQYFMTQHIKCLEEIKELSIEIKRINKKLEYCMIFIATLFVALVFFVDWSIQL